MKLSQFRDETKDLPDEAVLWVLTSEGAWTPVSSMVVRIEDPRHLKDYSREQHGHQFIKSIEIRLQ